MQKSVKIFVVILMVFTLFVQVVSVVQARFARGGAKQTYYDIIACKDGMVMHIGLALPPDSNTTPMGTINSAQHVRPSGSNITILNETTFTLNGPPATIIDTENGNAVNLTHTAVVSKPWTVAPLAVGSKIRLLLSNLRNPETGVARYFEAIVGNCILSTLPPDRDARIFYPAGGSSQNPGNNVPNITLMAGQVVTSVITVPPTAFSGQTIADVDVAMYLKGVAAGQVDVFLNSPGGSRLKLFGNKNSQAFGSREINLDNNNLVQFPMPDFVLDDESSFTFATSPAPFISEAIQPASALSQFNGQDPAGDWVLEVHSGGVEVCTVYSISPNQVIPDNDDNGVFHNINVLDDFVISDVEIVLDIQHQYVSDLDAWLYDPLNSVITQLFAGVGGSGDNFNGTRFDDEADQSIVDGVAPFQGSYRPQAPLSSFDGLSSKGGWHLFVRDSVEGDVGQLNTVDLRLCGARTGVAAGILDSWALDIEVEQSQNFVYLPTLQR